MSKQKLYQATYGNASIPSFKFIEANIPSPKENEVLIKHTAIGINFQDYQHYKHATTLPSNNAQSKVNSISDSNKLSVGAFDAIKYKVKDMLMLKSKFINNKLEANVKSKTISSDSKPKIVIPGIEAVGIVERIGESVRDVRVGQRVGYCTATNGAYSEYRTIDSKYVFPIHNNISDEAAVTNLVKAMTAHYLMRRTFYVQPNMIVLIHAGASSVGQAMIRLAKEYKAISIASIEDDNQNTVNLLKQLGCNYVINYNDSNWVRHVKEITNDRGVNVVYDCLGKETILQSIDCLMPFGLLALHGQMTGPVLAINPHLLTQKSLFFTAPELSCYKEDVMELLLSSLEVFALIDKGVLPKKATKTYKFTSVTDAMLDIEHRKHLGPKIILL